MFRFLGFRFCFPSSVHASSLPSNTFCTCMLEVFPNTAGHQIVLRRSSREACSIRRSTSSAASPCKTNLSNSKVQLGWEFSPPLPSPGHASAAGRRHFFRNLQGPDAPDASWKKLCCPTWRQDGPKIADMSENRRSWTHLGANFAQHRTGKAPRCHNHPIRLPQNHEKPIKT